MIGATLRISIALGSCLSAGGCGAEERYVVSQTSNQMMIVDQIDRTGTEPKARITIISSKREPSEVNDRLIRRLSFEARFRCGDGTLRYGASVATLEVGGTFSAPAETGSVWEHPSPDTGKAHAVRAVCLPGSTDAMRVTDTLAELEQKYRGGN
jgi:hypothetical protein